MAYQWPKLIFAGMPIGSIILPLMIFHQLQLMACAVIANKLGKRPLSAEEIETEKVTA
ncbi:bile acid:sodium symporter [Oligella ureolytica]